MYNLYTVRVERRDWLGEDLEAAGRDSITPSRLNQAHRFSDLSYRKGDLPESGGGRRRRYCRWRYSRNSRPISEPRWRRR